MKHVKITATFMSWAQRWMDSLDVDWEQLSFVAASLDDVEEAFCTVIFDLERSLILLYSGPLQMQPLRGRP